MGTAPLGLRLTRRIAREIGHPVKRAVGHGGYTFEFVTFEHEHGWWNKGTGEFGFYTGDEPLIHWASCCWNFPAELLVPNRPMPESLCGAYVQQDGLDLICSQPAAEHGKRHVCGSEAWPVDPADDEPGKPIERYP